MTIKLSVEIRNDLFATGEWPLFSADRAAAVGCATPKLGVISFKIRRRHWQDDFGPLALACWDAAKHAINNSFAERQLRTWLFLSHVPWQPDNRIVRYRRLWNSFPEFFQIDDFVTKGPEVEFSSPDGIRYSSVAQLTDEGLAKTVDLVRRSMANSACAIIFSDRAEFESERNIRELFVNAFPQRKGVPQTSIDWMTLSVGICPIGDILVRAFEWFDDREVCIDVFASGANIELMSTKVRQL